MLHKLLGVLFIGCLIGVAGFATEDMVVINIQVSPQTILIGADQAEMVTVHADIPYRLVDTDLMLTLNDVEVEFTFSDSRGDLVAKFDSSSIKDKVAPGQGEMTLSGMMTDGTIFTGSTIVQVVQYSGKPKKK